MEQNPKTVEEIEAEMQQRREEFMKMVDVRILGPDDKASSFSCIVDSRRTIVIK